MAILTVAAQLGAGGELVGLQAARQLEIPYADALTLADAAERLGISRRRFAIVDEQPPGFLGRLLLGREGGRDILVRVIGEVTRDRDVVLVYWGGQAILGHVPEAFHLLVTAPFDHRVRRVMERKRVPARDASRIVSVSDRQRSAYMRAIFGVDWLDPGPYDLTVDTEALGIDGAAERLLAAWHPAPASPRGRLAERLGDEREGGEGRSAS